jgi:hypothetical protein
LCHHTAARSACQLRFSEIHVSELNLHPLECTAILRYREEQLLESRHLRAVTLAFGVAAPCEALSWGVFGFLPLHGTLPIRSAGASLMRGLPIDLNARIRRIAPAKSRKRSLGVGRPRPSEHTSEFINRAIDSILSTVYIPDTLLTEGRHHEASWWWSGPEGGAEIHLKLRQPVPG